MEGRNSKIPFFVKAREQNMEQRWQLVQSSSVKAILIPMI